MLMNQEAKKPAVCDVSDEEHHPSRQSRERKQSTETDAARCVAASRNSVNVSTGADLQQL